MADCRDGTLGYRIAVAHSARGDLCILPMRALAPLALLVALTGAAPPTDCPPGSVGKASGEFAWCEPTGCENDTQCRSGELCRPMKLCVQVGNVGDAGDKGERLVTTGPCGAGCPPNTVCSDKKRCVDRASAQRLNLL